MWCGDLDHDVKESGEKDNLELEHSFVEEENKLLRENIEKLQKEVKDLTNAVILKYILIENMKQEKDALDNALESAEKNWKESKRVDKTKDKENHDLQQENGKVTESFDIVRKELKELTLQVKKDKNEQDKKLKKEQKKQEKVNNLQPIPENIFLCYKCDLCTDSMNKLREHIRIKH